MTNLKVKVTQSCPTLCNHIDYTVHGILQVRILEWVAPSPGDLPNPGIEPRSPALQAVSLPVEPPGKPKNAGFNSWYPFSSRFSQPRNHTGISCIAGSFFTNWATREAQKKTFICTNAWVQKFIEVLFVTTMNKEKKSMQVFIRRWMNKQIVVYPYNETLFSNKKELNVDIYNIRASLVAQTVKNSSTMQETWVRSLGQKDPLEKEMATHSSILAWRVP